MSDYFDQLELALRAAVPLSVAEPAAPAAHRRRYRVRPGALAVVLAAVVAIAIVIGAIALLGHRHAPVQPTHGNRRPRHGRLHTNQYALGSVPTLAQLEANFAILRRPQTPLDRSWKPECGCGGSMRQLDGLTRHARTLPGGVRIFLDMTQTEISGDMDMPDGTYLLNLDIVGPHGVDSTSFGPNVQYTVYPLDDRPGLLRAHPTPSDDVWAGLVPDGVASVRWTFACPAGRAKRRPACAVPHARTFTVPVIYNIAAERIAHAGLCAGCPGPTHIAWYDTSGHVVWRLGLGSNLAGPPFVKGARGARRLAVLHGNGVAGARFGQTAQQAEQAMSAALGPAARTEARIGGCGIDHESAWVSPEIATPLTVYLRAGRFVGYSYGAPRSDIGTLRDPGAVLTTTRGLTVDDTVGQARRAYGSHLATSAARGGTWSARDDGGTLAGELVPVTYPLRKVTSANPIATVGAGETGCTDTTP